MNMHEVKAEIAIMSFIVTVKRSSRRTQVVMVKPNRTCTMYGRVKLGKEYLIAKYENKKVLRRLGRHVKIEQSGNRKHPILFKGKFRFKPVNTCMSQLQALLLTSVLLLSFRKV
jgi:hypothetical protein